MPKKINVDKMAEEYAAYGKKKRKPLSYAAKLITVLAVTAALVSASVICLSLYLTGVFDEIGELPPDNNTDNGEQLYEGFIDYTFNANKMPSGSYAEFTFLADGSTYKVQAYLFDSYAPNTVSNFISYVNKKFYNGKAFGEVTLGYDENGVPDSGKIICGGYKRNENGELVYELAEGALPIKGEFLENGYEKNKLSNTAGVIGMIHGESNDNATTDFYILPYDDLSLNGKYAAFAKITDSTGLGVIRSLARKAYENNTVVTISEVKILNKK